MNRMTLEEAILYCDAHDCSECPVERSNEYDLGILGVGDYPCCHNLTRLEEIEMTENELQRIIDHYGIEAQRMKAVEELSELIKAVAKNDRTNIVEEIADVKIMIGQLQLIYNIPTDDIWAVMDQKLARTLERIEHDH